MNFPKRLLWTVLTISFILLFSLIFLPLTLLWFKDCYTVVSKCQLSQKINCLSAIKTCAFNESILEEQIVNEISKEEEPYWVWQECMDQSLDPCDDFYKFACNNYEQKYAGSDRYDEKRFFYKFDNQTNKCFLDAFNSGKSNSSSAVQKMRQYQREYERTEGREEISVSRLMDEIESFGKCPALSFKKEWNRDEFDLIDMLLKMTNLTGNGYLFELVKVNIANGVMYPLIRPSKLIFSKTDPYLTSEYRWLNWMPTKKIRSFFFEMFERIKEEMKPESTYDDYGDYNEDGFGSGSGYETQDMFEKDYTKISMELAELEKELLSVYTKHSYFDDKVTKTYHYKSLKEIGLNEAFGTTNRMQDYLLENVQITYELNEYIYEQDLFVRLQKNFIVDLLEVYKKLSKEQLANHLCLRYIIDRLPYLNENFQKSKRMFEANFYDKTNLSPKFDDDTKHHVELMFPLVSDHLFVQHCQIKPNQIEKAREIAENVRISAMKWIENAEWVDPKTKNNVISKLNHTLIDVGATKIAFDQEKLDKLYESLEFEENDGIIEMEKKVRLFNHWNEMAILYNDNPYSLLESQNARATINNAYSNRKAAIFLPLGGLFPPKFDVDQPYSINYGGVGYVTGHELFHLLDSTGVGYILRGILNSVFDDLETKADYEERIHCLQRQFSRQKDQLAEKHLDGLKTLDENIADDAGIRVAYYAYLDLLKRQEDFKVSGFSNYTNEQSFFIGYAMEYCSAYPSYDRRYIINNYKHSLPNYRVNIPLKNFPEFARAFNCSLGTNMHPRKKCRVWK